MESEHAKMSEVSEDWDTIMRFLDWLTNQKGIRLAEFASKLGKRVGWDEKAVLEYEPPFHDPLVSSPYDKKELVAEFFGIDWDAYCKEADEALKLAQRIANGGE